MKSLIRNCVVTVITFTAMAFPYLAAAQDNTVISGSDVARLRAFIGDADLAVGSGAPGKGSSARGAVVDGVYVVRVGDTLSEIMAQHLGDTGLNDEVLQRVIIRNNKTAFRRGNPHWLMAGAHLRMPTADDVMEYVVPGQAKEHSGRADEWVSYP